MLVRNFPRRTLLMLLTASLTLAACNVGATPAPTVDVNAINTAAVATAMGQISAQLTQTALAAPTNTPPPTVSPLPLVNVVVVDTPPVGPVSDALTLGRFADISFFVIRHRHTLRSTMKLINKLNDGKKLPRLTLIINGVKDNKEFSYGNDFGYGYGYQAKEGRKGWKGITTISINNKRSETFN